MKKLALAAAVLISFSASITVYSDGIGAEHGGGFEFYYSDADKVITESQALAIKIVTGWPKSVWQNPYFVKPVNRDVLISYIKSAVHNQAKDMTRKDPRGEDEPLLMNYVDQPGNRHIEILAGAYRETKLELENFEDLNDIRLDLARELVHESLHLFGYNESEAYRVSRFVYGVRYILQCDEVSGHLPGYECLFPTPERLDHIRNLVRRWYDKGVTQPYVVLLGDLESGLVRVNISKRRTWFHDRISAFEPRVSSFIVGSCVQTGNGLIQYKCQTVSQYFIADLYQAITVPFNEINPCPRNNLDCESEFDRNGISGLIQWKANTEGPAPILVKRVFSL